jgi:phosphomannomutase
VHAVIGGEGSGGVILPACHEGRDSLVGIALITTLMQLRNATLQEVAADLPVYHMIKTKLALAERSLIGPLIERCKLAFADATIRTEDGLHCSWADRWIHIRASNTEPIMRVIAEAPHTTHAAELIARVQALLEE